MEMTGTNEALKKPLELIFPPNKGSDDNDNYDNQDDAFHNLN